MENVKLSGVGSHGPKSSGSQEALKDVEKGKAA